MSISRGADDGLVGTRCLNRPTLHTSNPYLYYYDIPRLHDHLWYILCDHIWQHILKFCFSGMVSHGPDIHEAVTRKTRSEFCRAAQVSRQLNKCELYNWPLVCRVSLHYRYWRAKCKHSINNVNIHASQLMGTTDQLYISPVISLIWKSQFCVWYTFIMYRYILCLFTWLCMIFGK